MRIKRISLTIFLLTILLIASSCTNSQEFNETKDSEISNSETIETNENQSTEVSESNISEKDAKEFFRDYLKTLYTIEDFNTVKGRSQIKSVEDMEKLHGKLKPYMTEKGYKEIFSDRFLQMLNDFSKDRAANIAVKTTDFQLENKKDDELFYWYKVTLSLEYLDNSKSNRVIEGQAHLVKDNEAFKVNTDSIMNLRDLFRPRFQGEITTNLPSVIEKDSKGNYKQVETSKPGVSFAISNTSSEKTQLNFSSIPQFSITLYQNDEKVWSYGDSSTFRINATPITLSPGEHLVYHLPYPQNVTPGTYNYTFRMLSRNLTDVKPLKGTLTISDDY